MAGREIIFTAQKLLYIYLLSSVVVFTTLKCKKGIIVSNSNCCSVFYAVWLTISQKLDRGLPPSCAQIRLARNLLLVQVLPPRRQALKLGCLILGLLITSVLRTPVWIAKKLFLMILWLCPRWLCPRWLCPRWRCQRHQQVQFPQPQRR